MYENSWHAERFKMISVGHMHVILKSHQRNKTNRTQHKEEVVDKIFSKMDVLHKWEQVTLFCYVHKKTVFCFVFSEIKNQFFFVSLTPCLLLRGLNVSVVNYQNHGKTQEKVNLYLMLWTLRYRHYIMDITSYIILWTMTFIMAIIFWEK